MKGFVCIEVINTFSHSTDHDSDDLLWTAHIASFNHFELFLGPTLVLWSQLLLQHWVSLVNILELLLVRPELAGLEDDDEKREAS